MRKYEVPNEFADRVVREFNGRASRDNPKERPYYGAEVKPKNDGGSIITFQGLNEYIDPKIKEIASELGIEVKPLSCLYSGNCPILRQFNWLNLKTGLWNSKDEWEHAICLTPKFDDCWAYKKLIEQNE